jgi:hypothetical protein
MAIEKVAAAEPADTRCLRRISAKLEIPLGETEDETNPCLAYNAP